MKKTSIALLIFISAFKLSAQDIQGMWMGALPATMGNLHFIVNIVKNADTSYVATFDSPDQKSFGLPVDKIYIKGDSVFLSAIKIGVGYQGVWDKKDGITGFFKQGSKIPLNLVRQYRPQTPKPPFGYYSEDVEYDNADKSLHYGATFTRPKAPGKYPAVIIITGSGTQDRDGTLFGHKLYWVLADHLTKNGIAVLRVDDRGAGKSSEGSDLKNATSLDFSHDVETSLNYLETRNDVDKKHLGLIGHSEGGIIAPMVAARRKDVSFMVMWGAPETGGARINAQQNAYYLSKGGIDSTAVRAFTTLHLQILQLFATATNVQDLDLKIRPVFDAWKKSQPYDVLKALYVQDSSIIGKDIMSLYNDLYNVGWMRFFIAYDPATDLARVKCAVLAINGEKDTQVAPAANLAKIKAVLAQAGNKNFDVKELPGLNHLLQPAQTGDLGEYEETEQTMSPVALNIICSWIKLHTQ